LIGLNVETIWAFQLGVVESLLETGANDVVIVKGERERVIPFLQGQTIINIDLDAGRSGCRLGTRLLITIMRFDVVTIISRNDNRGCKLRVTGRAIERKIVSLSVWNPRDYTHDKHRTVDDRPYGGGPGW